ncbi:MAG: geranylgeranylglycerol-phosphate geranylgeranyltransferase [Crocinitomicaceae bacterium]|nr:geranylgeranylglycerol-phosphate geranylgeranyltransferase [Crocinitomicaceae bacterium]MDG1777397.1 geranylgeranylglycerol-phosphate geranylgeranyltransferase [Crocinitomicaceae bacterium]
MIHFIQLIRPINLFIIGLTMYGLGWYLEGVSDYSEGAGLMSIEFALLVFSTIMIAAAGNIINDYFDVKADRINKPERLIIGKFVKRRVAIAAHWTINFFAFGIALYLSWKLDTFWYLFIHLFSINLLWYHSVYLKRKFLIGNVLIALLTALVPIIVGFYFHDTQNISIQNPKPFPIEGDNFILLLSFGLAGFAFLLNLAREIIKDIEDIKGDIKINARTLPIVLGTAKSKVISALILSTAIISSGVLFSFFTAIEPKVLFPILISALFILTCLLLLPKAQSKSQLKIINNGIKLAMIAGLISPLYWKLLLIYG